MPLYRFVDQETGLEHEELLKASELDDYLKDNPNLQKCLGAPLIHSGRGMAKPDSNFRDLLKEIKKSNSKGTSKSTVNTF